MRKMYRFQCEPVIEVGDRRLDDENLFVVLGDRQHRQCHGGAGTADRDVGAVVVISFVQEIAADVGFGLAVLLDDDKLMSVDHHGAAGGVIQSHGEAGRRLFGVRFERAGLVGNQRDLDRTFGGVGLRGPQSRQRCADRE